MKLTRLSILMLAGIFTSIVPVGLTQAEVKAPACRMVSIKLQPVTKNGEVNQPNLCPDAYAKLCDEAVTQLDARCQANCARFKKRAEAPLEGAVCGPTPVVASTDEYDAAKQCVEKAVGDRKTYALTCTVSASCICDP
jgi:hypothetical protein